MTEIQIGDLVKYKRNGNATYYWRGYGTIEHAVSGRRYRASKEKLMLVEAKMEYKEEDLLQFHELEEGKFYKLLHGGERDHGYTYILNSAGALYNTSKNRLSKTPFNVKTRFVESNEYVKKYPSLSYSAEFKDSCFKVGCQELTLEDAVELALDIIERYGE